MTMRKILLAIVLGVLTIGAATSCVESNSPEGVVRKQMKCLKNKDAEGLVDLLDWQRFSRPGSNPVEEKAQLVSMVQEKGFKKIDERGGLKSYEILDVDAPKEATYGSIAFVKVRAVFGNGTEEESRIKVKMDDYGRWKLAMEK